MAKHADPNEIERINTLQNALLRSSTQKEAFTVYRQIKANGVWGNPKADEVVNFFQNNIGEEYTDKTFLSTSIVPDAIPEQRVRLRIFLPKGTKGAYVESITANPGEREFLMPYGKKLKVLKVEKVGETEHGESIHEVTLKGMPTTYTRNVVISKW